jgi:hypothetical protein
MRLEGLGQLKNPMASSGIEPVTYRLVAQCLNQVRYGVSPGGSDKEKNPLLLSGIKALPSSHYSD